MLLCTVQVPQATAAAEKKSVRATSSRTHHLQTRNLTQEERQSCALAVQKTMELNENKWRGKIQQIERTHASEAKDTDKTHVSYAQNMMDDLVIEFRRAITDTCSQALGRTEQAQRRPYRAKELSTIKRKIRNITTVLRYVNNASLKGDKPHRAIYQLKQEDKSLSALGQDLQAWGKWAHEHGSETLRVLRRARDSQYRTWVRQDSPQSIYYDARARKTFYDRFFRYKKQMKVDSALDPETGKTTQNPDKYKELIREAWADVFAKTKEAPSKEPAWWKETYAKSAKQQTIEGDNKDVFSDIMRQTDADELHTIIKEAESHKASEHEVTIDILKIVCECKSIHKTENKTLAILSELVNLCFRTHYMPKPLKKGKMVLLPKAGSAGSTREELLEQPAKKMRPITILPELGKLPMRILAKRISHKLVQNPKLLHEAQRAFTKNGNVSQGQSLTVDIFEDFHENKAPKQKELYVVSYDQSKAFDSVQHYTIEASLRRFNIPEPCISFIMSSLTDAETYVMTAAGPTKTFPILTSVRQGDPLSPLLYIFVADALHAKLDEMNVGYEFSNRVTSTDKRIASTGYADDLTIFGESWDNIKKAHVWVCDFFAAHGFEFNADKSHFSYLPYDPAHPKSLPSVKEHMENPEWAERDDHAHQFAIKSRPPTEAFRHLGLHVTLTLDWTAQIDVMCKAVARFAGSVKHHKMDIFMATNAVREYLLPKLEAGLKYAEITDAQLHIWTSAIIRAINDAEHVRLKKSLKHAAMLSVCNIPCLKDYRDTIRATELTMLLNCRTPSPSTRAAWARIRCAIPHAKQKWTIVESANSTHEWVIMRTNTVDGLTDTKEVDKNRYVRTARQLKKINIEMQDNPHPWWKPEAQVQHKQEDARTTVAEWLEKQARAEDGLMNDSATFTLAHVHHLESTKEIVIYTDGSTKPRGTAPNSGFAACWRWQNRNGCTSGGLRSDRNNYLAELAGILAALTAAPANLPLHVISDSQAAIATIKRDQITERDRIRCPGRALVTSIRKLIRARSSPTNISYVRAHTQQGDEDSKGNEEADKQAKLARQVVEFVDMPYFSKNEESVTFRIGEKLVVGDLRTAVKAHLSARMAEAWATPSSRKHRNIQGELMAAYPRETTKTATLVRKMNNGPMLRFFLMGATQWLPTKDRFKAWKRGAEKENYNAQCPLCTSGDEDSTRHIFECKATQTWTESLRTEWQKVLHKHDVPWRIDTLYQVDEKSLAKFTMELAKRVGEDAKVNVQFCGLTTATTEWMLKSITGGGLNEVKMNDKVHRIVACLQESHTVISKMIHPTRVTDQWLQTLTNAFALNTEVVADAMFAHPRTLTNTRAINASQANINMGVKNFDNLQSALRARNTFAHLQGWPSQNDDMKMLDEMVEVTLAETEAQRIVVLIEGCDEKKVIDNVQRAWTAKKGAMAMVYSVESVDVAALSATTGKMTPRLLIVAASKKSTQRDPTNTKAFSGIATRWSSPPTPQKQIKPISRRLHSDELNHTPHWFDQTTTDTEIVRPHVRLSHDAAARLGIESAQRLEKAEKACRKLAGTDKLAIRLGIIPPGLQTLLTMTLEKSEPKAKELQRKVHSVCRELSSAALHNALMLYGERSRRLTALETHRDETQTKLTKTQAKTQAKAQAKAQAKTQAKAQARATRQHKTISKRKRHDMLEHWP